MSGIRKVLEFIFLKKYVNLFVPELFVERFIPFSLDCLDMSVENLHTVPHCVDYCSFIVCFKLGKVSIFVLLFKLRLVIIPPLSFNPGFRISLLVL